MTILKRRTTLRPLANLFIIQTVLIILGITVAPQLSIIQRVTLHSLLSALLSRFFRDTLPWQIANAAIPWGLLITFSFNIPPIFLGVIALLLLGVFLPSWWNDVPFYPTSSPVIMEIAQMLPNNTPFRFIDCGCGFGNILFQLANKFPHGRFIGVEVSPIPAGYGYIRSLFVSNVSIRWTNLWRESFSNYDYIYAFLSPEVSEQLATKLATELNGNSVAIINAFKLPDAVLNSVYVKKVKVSDDTLLYIYRCLQNKPALNL